MLRYCLLQDIMGFVYRNMFCLNGGPVLLCEHTWGVDEVSCGDSNQVGWSQEKSGSPIGGFIPRAAVLIRPRIFCYSCGYFIRGADNFMLVSM